MRKNRTPAECIDKYLSLTDELCKYWLPFRKFGNVYFVICADILGLVLNNEILSVVDLHSEEIYTVFGSDTQCVYRSWVHFLSETKNIDFHPQEYFVKIDSPCKLL